jgi:hypothetical protein
MAMPEIGERCLVFGADGHDIRISLKEFIIIPAQLRHMPAAVWSHETAVENQQYVSAPEI